MFATIYLPNFYLQAALRHQPALREKAVALLDERQRKMIVAQLNEAAEKTGVSIDMTPSQALARNLQLILKVRSAAQEKRIEEILLHFAFALSPFVEATAPGICTVEFKTEKNIVPKIDRVITQLEAVEIIGQAGVAPTPDLSLLAAHLARPILQINDARKFLAPLPIESLAMAELA